MQSQSIILRKTFLLLSVAVVFEYGLENYYC